MASKFKIGPRRYNGSSLSPQAGSGSVNPAGYKARDDRAKVKKQMLLDQMKRKGK